MTPRCVVPGVVTVCDEADERECSLERTRRYSKAHGLHLVVMGKTEGGQGGQPALVDCG